MNTINAKKPKVVRRLISPFITGILSIFPLAVTIVVLIWFFNLIKGYIGPESLFGQLLQSVGLNFVASALFAYFLGLLATLVIIYFFGLLVQAGLRNSWDRLTDNIMNRIPVIKTIYDAARKLIKLLDKKEKSEIKAMTPVMCYLGGKGGTGVLALLTSKEKILIDEMEYFSIMIPSSPVPIGGAILFVPVSWVEPVDFGFDGLFNVYMSMGVTAPDMLKEKPAQKE